MTQTLDEPQALGQALASYSPPPASSKAERLSDGDEEQQRRQAASLESWKVVKSAVGRRYTDCKISTYEATSDAQRRSVAEVESFIVQIDKRTSDGNGLILIGPPGTGKDHLAIGCLREAAKAGHTVGWVDGHTLYQKFRDLIGSDTQEKSAVDEYTRPGVLLISDPVPQVGSVTEHQLTILWRIVDRRYRDQKPTWATLNALDRAEAERRLAPQVVDRLCDGALVVACNWESYRKNRKA